MNHLAIQSVPTALEASVIRYRELKLQIHELEKEIEQHKSVIEAAVPAGSDQVIAGFRVLLSKCERDNFALGRARKELSQSVLELLAPFISKSSYNRLEVK